MPTAGSAHSAAQAQPHEGPAAGISSAQAGTEQEELRAAARRQAEAKQRREKRSAEDARWWRAAWREMETARARVLQIAQLVSGGLGRARYPEVLLVEHSPLLMELLCRQFEMQPLGASCWGGRHAAADEAQLVVMASAIAGRAEDLYRTGHMGPKDRGGALSSKRGGRVRRAGRLLRADGWHRRRVQRARRQPPHRAGGARASHGCAT